MAVCWSDSQWGWGSGVPVVSTDLHKACPRRGREGMALVLFVHVI